MTAFATGIDAFAFGAAPSRSTAPAFTGRLGSGEFPAQVGRYHLYAGWFCPRSHRALIQRSLAGLADAVTVSYVDGLRDGRGWAFRERTGPDTANGFRLLREAYEALSPDYVGPVDIPMLWDKRTRRIVSTDPDAIDVDLATVFGRPAGPGASESVSPSDDPGPSDAAGLIDGVGTRVAQLLGPSAVDPSARVRLLTQFADLDRVLSGRRFLTGTQFGIADVRLWVSLVRYDAGPNAHGAVGSHLPAFPHLWRYARELYAMPAFRDTTRFEMFAAPFASIPDWEATS